MNATNSITRAIGSVRHSYGAEAFKPIENGFIFKLPHRQGAMYLKPYVTRVEVVKELRRLIREENAFTEIELVDKQGKLL